MSTSELETQVARFGQNELRVDKWVNGGKEESYLTSNGVDVPTIRNFMENAIANGLMRGFNTEANLKLWKPELSGQYAKADDTKKVWRWEKTSSNPISGNWIATGLSELELAKNYVELNTNINLFRGISAHVPQYNANTFDKTTLKADYAPTEIRYKGMNAGGGFTVPFNGELRNKLQVWVKVKSAALNAGTNMRFLVQAVKQDNTTLSSGYTNVPDGHTGWLKLNETPLSEASRALFKHVNIQPHVVGGAEITVEDFYIGEGVPTNPFVRVNEPKDVTIARNSERKSILPHWTKMPVSDGVSYSENGDITIQAGKSLSLTVGISDVKKLFYCGYMDQSEAGNCRFLFRGYRKGLTTFNDVPSFPTAVGGNEIIASAAFDSVIDKLQLYIHNYSTAEAVTIRSFDICYSEVAPNGAVKIGDRFDALMLKSEIIQSVVSSKPNQNLSSTPNFEMIAKSADGKRYATNALVMSNNAKLSGLKAGVRYYISLPDAVATLNGGTAKLTVYHSRANGTSLGGATVDFMQDGGVLNASILATEETAGVNLRVDITGDAIVELNRLIISDVPYSSDLVFSSFYSEDRTGQISSDWEYPALTGFAKMGDVAANYPTYVDGGDLVVGIPNTAVAGDGQGVRWTVNMPEGGEDVFITYLAKTNYVGVNPTKLVVRYYKAGQASEITARSAPLVINRNGEWTLNLLQLPATYNGETVSHCNLYFHNMSTATEPLYLKRFIQTVGPHNPFVKFIKYVNQKSATGLSNFLRLKDALVEQPQTVFSVGRQLFRPLKDVQQTVSDYELVNGQSLLPKRLNNLRHIDSDGYLIAFLDRDDTVYLSKGAALYKTTVDDLNSRCVANSIVGSENRGIFDSSNLTLINSNAPLGWLRVTGDGTMVIVNRQQAFYSLDSGATWQNATGYQDVEGVHYNAWGVDCVDNVVLTSGYKVASEGRGTGRVNYSNDNGKSYQVILDIETSDFIDNARRGSMHIHSVKYDPYWDGVWVVMGDGAFQNPNTTVTSNIWFIENPATPEQTMVSFNSRGQDWMNEQHVSVFPMQDCILFGSDANPTGLYRMARTKNPEVLRDVVKQISTALSHYGCGGYQHKPYLPASIYFGKASEYVGNLNDVVILTYDGVNFVEIYKEPETSNTPSGKVNTFAFALDKYFIFERRTDQRFASGNCWIVGDIKYMR